MNLALPPYGVCTTSASQRIFMSNDPYDPTITEMLQTVAELIALKPAQEHSQWLIFMLGEMKSMLSRQGYVDLLIALQEEASSQLAAYL
jgi:hypothetical protein